jgi:hypothetical protein
LFSFERSFKQPYRRSGLGWFGVGVREEGYPVILNPGAGSIPAAGLRRRNPVPNPAPTMKSSPSDDLIPEAHEDDQVDLFDNERFTRAASGIDSTDGLLI